MIHLDTTETYNLWEILKDIEYCEDFSEEQKDLASWLKNEIAVHDELVIGGENEMPF